MDDSKLLQEARQPRRARRHITLYISFNKRRRLSSEGLVSVMGIIRARIPRAPRAKMLSTSVYAPPLGLFASSPTNDGVQKPCTMNCAGLFCFRRLFQI